MNKVEQEYSPVIAATEPYRIYTVWVATSEQRGVSYWDSKEAALKVSDSVEEWRFERTRLSPRVTLKQQPVVFQEPHEEEYQRYLELKARFENKVV